jgi:uncharacterized protein YbaR (Trm112 family)
MPEPEESHPPATKNGTPGPLDPAFLALLCCPVCEERPPLRLAEDEKWLLCDRCGTAYPIIEEYGFPDLRPPGDGATTGTPSV